MTEKRYFKREWEEEYYIFDSETISEKEFDEKVEYEDYNAFADSMQGDEVVECLNNLHENNQMLSMKMSEVYTKYRLLNEFSEDTNPNDAVKTVLSELMQITKEYR